MEKRNANEEGGLDDNLQIKTVTKNYHLKEKKDDKISERSQERPRSREKSTNQKLREKRDKLSPKGKKRKR